MKKKIMKFLSVMLAVVLTLTATPLSGFIGIKIPEWLDISIMSKATTGTCGDNLTWTYDEETCKLNISGTGAMCDFDYVNRPWESYQDSIKEVVIDNGVTSIGDNAFRHFDNLTSVTIPDSVTTIGENTFEFCINLTDLIIPDSVISIDCCAFIYCYNIRNIVLPQNLTTINQSVFFGCISLTDIIIPDSVTTIGNYAFQSCTSLASITIPDNVITIGERAFYSCSSLISVTIPDSVTTIYANAFRDCSSLMDVSIGKGLTGLAGPIFKNCNSLTSFTIPENVKYIGSMTFSGCKNLSSIIIPESVIDIRACTFDGCNSLADVFYCGTEEQWNQITISNDYNEPLLNATVHFNYCEHNFIDGTCTDCGMNKPITQELTPQIRFSRNNDGSYANIFDVRTRVMISDEDFTELVGATNEEAAKNIDKIGFVYTLDGENFSANSARAVAQGETVEGYIDKPVKYIQDADGYYMFTCLVTDIPETDKNYTLTAYAYICVNGKWYFSEEPMNADFNSLHSTYYPIACEKYGWNV